MISEVDLYTNSDHTKVVLADDASAAFLLVNAGREMPDAEVEAVGAGLLEQAKKLQPSEAKSKASGEDKAVKAPVESKGA